MSETIINRWQGIPVRLRQYAQWCITPGTNDDKAPRTIAGNYASSTDPSSWTDFETACREASERGWHIGFVLHESDPFTCVDLDVKDCTQDVHLQRYELIIATLDSYTERSRSGRGWHVMVEGAIGKGRRRDGVEIYSQERFVICTGNVVHDRPIIERQEMLSNMLAQMSTEDEPQIDLAGDDSPDWSAANFAVQDQGELGRLFRGDWQGRAYPSQSAADLALVKRLLPLTASPLECWRTFELSGLGKRAKAKRLDYARSTLARAAQMIANEDARAAHGEVMADALIRNSQSHGGKYFVLQADSDLAQRPPPRWLVKNIVPDVGVGTIYGQSGTFKSFIALDMLAHISNGRRWFDRPVIAAPAVYVPLEGQGGIPKRVAAWRLSLSHRGIPATTNMRFITEPMDLRQQAYRDKLVMTLIDNGWAGGVLCIDTLAQAGPGIDENTSQGMGEMISIFQELQRRLGGVVLVIHHSGKVEKAGLRGWSGLLGALDFSIRCGREDSWPWYEGQLFLEKVKDGETGQTLDFSMVRVTLGYDEDCEPVTSLAVVPPTFRQNEPEPDEAQVAQEDDDFVDGWIRREVEAGKRPTGRGLEAQRMKMKPDRDITQKRLRDAIARLKDDGRLVDEKGGPSGAKWLRPVDNSTTVEVDKNGALKRTTGAF